MKMEAMMRWNSWMLRRPSTTGTASAQQVKTHEGVSSQPIAAQLFKTGLEGCLAEDQSIFQKQASLLHAYIKD
jgi:hypothetical protein